MSNVPPVDDFPKYSFSRADVVFHAAGVLLNTSLTFAAALWLFSGWRRQMPSWYFLLLASGAGMFIGDFISGLLHWALDTWFTEETSLLNRMVITVREHHVYPDRVFEYSFFHHAGPLSWLAFLFTAPILFLAIFAPFGVVHYYLVWTAVVVSFEITFMFEFHKFGHRLQAYKITRKAQRLRLLLSPKHHLRHHSGNHDRNYCLINGIADDVCGNIFVWRGLEWIISSLTGAVPRSNDHKYLRRRNHSTSPSDLAPSCADNAYQTGTFSAEKHPQGFLSKAT